MLCLLNMVTAQELLDNDEYEGRHRTRQTPLFDIGKRLTVTEICEDVKEECGKYGKIEDMKVPRPSGGSRQSNGVGKIYLKYDSNDSASKALRALAGRKFADRTVVVTYFAEVCKSVPVYKTVLTMLRSTLTSMHGSRVVAESSAT